MKNRWSDSEVASFFRDPLKLRVYTSRLIGQEPGLVLQGGGNTSMKAMAKDYFGNEVETLFVKASGQPLDKITEEGFSPVRMDAILQLAQRKYLNDSEMVTILRASLLNPYAPNPSVEAILHGIIPFKFVDHSHSNAVITITNNPRGEGILKELYGDSVVVVPYVKPGFELAKSVRKTLEGMDLANKEGIILVNHGIFTFHDSVKVSYKRMIKLVTRAENYIKNYYKKIPGQPEKKPLNLFSLTRLRKEVSKLRGEPVLAVLNDDSPSVHFSQIKNVEKIASRGTLTPEHVIRIKPFPMLIDEDIESSVQKFEKKYETYFTNFASKKTKPLDFSPRWGVWPGQGTVSFGRTFSDAADVQSIVSPTLKAIQQAEALGGWKPITPKDLFDMEYWELELVKMAPKNDPHSLNGKVALVTGTAAGIGLAVAKKLHAQGAVVVGLDISPKVKEVMNQSDFMGVQCDITNGKKVQQTVETIIRKFGGLDILVSNAGIFTAGQYIENLDQSTWERSLNVNLTSAQQLLGICIPYLKNGIDPTVIFIGSRNVAAPGAGAAAYSVAKAGLLQLARVAALELCKDKIRVNTIHPDAVFDTELWTPEALERSANRYGMSVEEYKTKNLMKTEITSNDVANMVLAMAGPAFAKTTGASIPLDGGNDRVI